MDIAYCGLQCRECPVYLATAGRKEDLQARLADEYSTDTVLFTKEDMVCMGCHSHAPSEKMCGGCAIRACCMEKSCRHCAECSEFPCKVLSQALTGNPDQMTVLKQLADKYQKKQEIPCRSTD